MRPDNGDYVLSGVKSGSSEFGSVGQKYGAKTHTLTKAEMPSHRHGLGNGANNDTVNATYSYPDIIGGGGVAMVNVRQTYSRIAGPYLEVAGSDQAHNNIQPTAVALLLIKT